MMQRAYLIGRFSRWSVVMVLVTLAAGPCAAAPPQDAKSGGDAPQAKSQATEAGTSAETAAAKGRAVARAKIAKRLADVERAIATFQSRQPQANLPSDLQLERELLKFAGLAYAQQEAVELLSKELVQRKADAEARLQALRSVGPDEPKPYSFLLLDQLRDDLAAEAARHDSLEAEITAATSLLESVRRSYEKNEQQRRRVQEAIETSRDPNAAASLARQLTIAKLRSLATRETTRVRVAEIENNKGDLELSKLRTVYLTEKEQIVARDVTFSQDDLQKQLAELNHNEQQLKEQIDRAQSNLNLAEQQWFEAKQRLDRAPEHSPALIEAVAAWQLARDTRQKVIVLVNQRLGELVIMRFLWDCRYKVVNELASDDQVCNWGQSAEEFLERQRQAERLLEIRMANMRMDLAALQARLSAAEASDPQVASWIKFELQQLERLINAAGANLVQLTTRQRLLTQVTAELAAETAPSSFEQWIATAGYTAKATWNYELASIDDRPITVRKIVSGLILFLCGWFASRFVSQLVGHRLLPRFGMDAGIASALQSIVFYVLVLSFGFLALEWSNVPLTVFTFMGGAVAIGVGFGSQNVLNNFISGLILLAERPIRVGDLVDIDGLYGTIERVGPRSTRVKTGSNLEIIVPNSKFLENNVTNWTLSDTRIRTKVTIGVAYGSPTRETSRLLHQAVTEHPNVLSDPEPIVLFREFGDNALAFEVHFWIRMRTVMQGQKIESEIRHTLDTLLSEANITIAFPQRDIHIDTTKPIEISLRDATASQMPRLPAQHAA
jgi:potassium efflux system protein